MPASITISNRVLTRSIPYCTGGVETTAGGRRIHTFTGDGTLVVIDPGNVESLIIAGGGGGAGNGASVEHCMGSGGAGGLVYTAVHALTAGNKTVTIGAGGSGGAAGAAPAGNSSTNGGNSVLDAVTATGGGAGKQSAVGANGGSGGGGGAWGGAWAGGAAAPPGQGNAGGAGTTGGAGSHGGGGGGSASVGGGGTGVGGNGTSYSISGAPVTYAAGGSHGGAAGAANTGNGGGGALANNPGTAGGSGIVIVSYPILQGATYTRNLRPSAGASNALAEAGTYSNWSQKIRGLGGFWRCSFIWHDELSVLMEMMAEGWVRDIRVMGERGMETWEGFVAAMELSISGGMPALKVTGYGYFCTLFWRVYNQTASGHVDAIISAEVATIVTAVGAFIASQALDVNASLVDRYHDADRFAGDLLFDMCAAGNSQNHRFLIGCYEDRQLRYQEIALYQTY